ncbi:MAG TPA: ketoacid CoA transferase [Pseudomonadales bacterium]|nr:ketoacid CoA transferase [Pseudomonadales bacterium]
MTAFSLAELMVCAGAEAFRHDGEVLATGIGVLPRLAASLAMTTCNPDLMMTDSEAWVLSTPNPVSGRKVGDAHAQETWMGFSRIFDNVWSGRRHAMVGPSQVDRFGQANISALGDDYHRPKVQMLGVRGFPGNSISHANSFFIPSHNRRVFVEGECDVVASIGYNPARLPRGYALGDIDIRVAITNLCVMDWRGEGFTPRVISLHPGVSKEEVCDNTGFALTFADTLVTTALPTAEQLSILQTLDPRNVRATQLPDNPPGVRTP